MLSRCLSSPGLLIKLLLLSYIDLIHSFNPEKLIISFNNNYTFGSASIGPEPVRNRN